MKALVLTESELSIRELKSPLKPTTVEGPFTTVKVASAALNHRDQYIREGKYAKIQYPAVLGSDVSGYIMSRDGEVQTDELYVVDPTFAWGDNDAAQSTDMNILGMPSQGGFAEQVIVPIDHLHPAPTHLSADEAAAIPLAGVTAWRALMYQGRCTKDDTVYITGVGGGVATMAMQFALAIGCNVIVSSRSRDKLDALEDHEHVKDAKLTTVLIDDDGEWVSMIKKLKPNLIVDSIAGDTVNHLTDILVPGGRLIFYGASAGTVPAMNIHRVYWKQLTIKGSTMGTEDDFADMLSVIERYEIHPIIDKVYPLEEAEAAFDRMKDAQQLGKIVFKISE